jgi:lipoate-protein ligase A
VKNQVMPFAFDDGLIAQAKGSVAPVADIYPFGFPAIVAGRGSDIGNEIYLDNARADRIPIYRRRGGGCSVFLDPGNVIVSIAFPAKGFDGIQALFNLSSDWMIQKFEIAGVTGIYQDGISDIVKENRKIGGSCFYRAKGIAYYSAAILVTPDLGAMDRYLAHPPREPVYRGNRRHKAFVSGLNRWFPELTAEKFSLDLMGCRDPSLLSVEMMKQPENLYQFPVNQ